MSAKKGCPEVQQRGSQVALGGGNRAHKTSMVWVILCSLLSKLLDPGKFNIKVLLIASCWVEGLRGPPPKTEDTASQNQLQVEESARQRLAPPERIVVCAQNAGHKYYSEPLLIFLQAPERGQTNLAQNMHQTQGPGTR